MNRFNVFGKSVNGLSTNRIVETHTGKVICVVQDLKLSKAIASTIEKHPELIEEYLEEKVKR